MAANMGQVFAFAAVFVFVITTLGSSVMWGVDADAEVDDPYLLAKYGVDTFDFISIMHTDIGKYT